MVIAVVLYVRARRRSGAVWSQLRCALRECRREESLEPLRAAARRQDGTEFSCGLFCMFACAVFVLSAMSATLASIPFDARYLTSYDLRGTITATMPAEDAGYQQYTSRPVISVDTFPDKIVPDDTRLSAMVGQVVDMRCTIAWVPGRRDILHCSLAK